MLYSKVLLVLFHLSLGGSTNAWYTAYDERVTVKAGEYFFPVNQFVGKYERYDFDVRIDTTSLVCAICEAEEVRACIRYGYDHRQFCRSETTQNTIRDYNKDLSRFETWDNPQWVGFQCMNESNDCDVRLWIRAHFTQLPTSQPTKIPTKAPSKSPTKTPSKLPTRTPSKSPTKAPSGAPTNFPTKSPTRFPTNAPTLRPTRGPRALPDSLQCKEGTRYRSFIPQDSWTVCGCDPKRVDQICHFCCRCSTSECMGSEYNDLVDLPIYYGRWRLAGSSTGGNGNYLTAKTKIGLEISYGVDYKKELSEILENKFGENDPIGFSFSSLTPPWMIELLEGFGYDETGTFSTSKHVSKELGTVASQTKYLSEYQENGCSHTCQNRDGPIKIWQWYVTDYEERFIIHQCEFRCSNEDPPLCPPYRCQEDDPNCQCCKVRTFGDELLDLTAASMNYTSSAVDPYYVDPKELQQSSSLGAGYIVLIVVGSIILCCVSCMICSSACGDKSKEPSNLVVAIPYDSSETSNKISPQV